MRRMTLDALLAGYQSIQATILRASMQEVKKMRAQLTTLRALHASLPAPVPRGELTWQKQRLLRCTEERDLFHKVRTSVWGLSDPNPQESIILQVVPR